MRQKIKFQEVFPLIEHMRLKLNSYELFIRSDGVYLLDGQPISDNHIVCILKRDAENANVPMPKGRVRDFTMRYVLEAWRKRLITALDSDQGRVNLTETLPELLMQQSQEVK